MITSLKLQIKLLLNFIKAYWFLTGLAVVSVVVAKPWAAEQTEGFLTPIIREIHIAENTAQLVKIDSVNVHRDSIRLVQNQAMLDSAFAIQNHRLDSLNKITVFKHLLSITTDTIPRFENGKKKGYYLIMMLPDGTPVVNENNSIFLNPQ